MVKTIGMDEKIAEIKGINSVRKQIKFSLSLREIKHIRRTTRLYLQIHPILEKDKRGAENLSKKILNKFKRFGSLKGRQNKLKKKMNGKEYICSWEGCNIKENLTIDHIRPLSAEGGNKSENLRWLCSNHHKVREIDYVLKRKRLEVETLEKEKENLLDKK